MKKTVTKIERNIPKKITRTRVAAYARVSCGKDAMLHSLSAQISYYSNLIQQHKDWVYVGVYVDEAVSGTKESRNGLQRLLDDCRDGKIDLVITKSISRFARNTVTLLKTVRGLKGLGVDVYFEEQNIHSMSNDGELMLTILASYAQEESRSVSENCKWRIRKNFEKGIASTFSLYGYEKINGEITIKEDEAEVVRKIFDLYLSGMGTMTIVKYLRQNGIPSPTDKKWYTGAINGMLTNEKYAGDMLLQKYYNKDHICKRSTRNKGVLPKYYVESTHPAIISKEDFNAVQRLIIERNKCKERKSRDYAFKGIVFCGRCGWRYLRKKNYKKYVWKCGSSVIEGYAACGEKQIPDSILHELADGFDKEIEKIVILPENNVKFIFTDKSEAVKHWIMPSKADSWTDEMKEAARQKALERRSNDAGCKKN